jgi:NADH dehydrogenase
VPFTQAKGETEQRLGDIGMSWTVLQPDAYMGAWFPIVIGEPAFAGQPVSLRGRNRQRHSFVAMRDVGA